MPRVLELAIRDRDGQARRVGRDPPRRRRPAGVRRSRGRSMLASSQPRRCRPADSELEQLARAAERGTQGDDSGGAGCAGAHAELIASAGALKAPIVHALRGKEYVEYDNPYDVGMTGLLGFSSGLSRDDGLRCPARCSAPTSRISSSIPKKANVAQVDVRGRKARTTHAARSRTGRRREGDARGAAAVARGKDRRAATSTSASSTTRRRARSSTSCDRRAGQGADSPAVRRHASSTSWRRGRRHLHLRRRDADRVGGALPDDERQAASVRFVRPRIDGERAAAGDRRAAAATPDRQVISLSGDGGVRHVARRPAHVPAAQPAGQDRGLQQRHARLRGARDEGGRFAPLRHRPRQPGFRQDGRGRRDLGIRVEDPADLRAATRAGVRARRPGLVDVVVNRQELSMPPTISWSRPRGSACT